MTDYQTLPVITDDPARWRLIDVPTGIAYGWDRDVPPSGGWAPVGVAIHKSANSGELAELVDPNGLDRG